MASVKFRLGIQSSTTTTDKLDFSVEKNTPVTTPYGALSRTEVPHTTPQVLSGTSNPDQMIYIKNLDTTNYVDVMNNAGEIMSKVLPGLFVLLCVPASAGIEVQADTAAVDIEYGFWSMP
jgi:hypothetical protein